MLRRPVSVEWRHGVFGRTLDPGRVLVDEQAVLRRVLIAELVRVVLPDTVPPDAAIFNRESIALRIVKFGALSTGWSLESVTTDWHLPRKIGWPSPLRSEERVRRSR